MSDYKTSRQFSKATNSSKKNGRPKKNPTSVKQWKDKTSASRKGWVQLEFKRGLKGYLSRSPTTYKRLTVTHPPNSSDFYLIKIGKMYRKSNTPAEEGVYLLEEEYTNLLNILPYDHREKQLFEMSGGRRELKICPNKKHGGLNIYQTVQKLVVNPKTQEEYYTQQNRKLYLSKEEIKIILDDYGALENCVKDYHSSSYFYSNDDESGPDYDAEDIAAPEDSDVEMAEDSGEDGDDEGEVKE